MTDTSKIDDTAAAIYKLMRMNKLNVLDCTKALACVLVLLSVDAKVQKPDMAYDTLINYMIDMLLDTKKETKEVIEKWGNDDKTEKE